MIAAVVVARRCGVGARESCRRRTLQTGFVGLPNVGKSTLFNALVKGSTAEAANFPFCTIEAQRGLVAVGDSRLERLAALSASEKIVRSTLTFVDIAGLVEGASDGQGLGNKFLQDIREVDAIVHVVRCFSDEDVVHVLEGDFDPVRDATIIDNELVLADLAQVERRIAKKSGLQGERAALCALRDALEDGTPARRDPEHAAIGRELGLLSAKPIIYAANVDDTFEEDDCGVDALRSYAKSEGGLVVTVSAQLESELMELDDDDRAEFLASAGISEERTAMYSMVRATAELLDLMVFYTTGPTESRAWQCRRGTAAPQAAGVIHTDFERKFIRAECVSYENFMEAGSWAGAKDLGWVRAEGKDYVVKDGDVLLVRHGA